MMDYKVKRVLLDRRDKVIVEEGSEVGENVLTEVGSLLRELIDLGYVVDNGLYEALKDKTDVNQLSSIYKLCTTTLSEKVGLKNYKVMYPNFPKEVLGATESELVVNALLHYWTHGEFKPNSDIETRDPMKDKIKYRMLSVGKEKDLQELLVSLVTSKTVYTERDKQDIQTLVEYFGASISLVDHDVSNRENLIYLMGVYEGLGLDLTGLLNTATDVLRYIVTSQGGHESLGGYIKIRAIKREARRRYLSYLENIPYPLEDMYRNRELWLRVAEKLHPNDYKAKYPRACASIEYIRKHRSYKEGFNSKYHKYLGAGEIENVCRLLSERPSEFGRRLNEVIRHTKKEDEVEIVLDYFERVAKDMSIKVLVAVHDFFASADSESRIILPNHKQPYIRVGDKVDNKKILSVVERVKGICKDGIALQGVDKEAVAGTVYVDKALAGVKVPTSTRGMSGGIEALPRFSRVPIGDKANIRAFIYWKGYLVDVDLSVLLLDSDYTQKGKVSYTCLRAPKGVKIVHSGDIISAPEGASEYVDIDIESALAAGIRYVCMEVYMFSSQNFSELEECGVGFMTREDADSGAIFEPKTVKAHYKVEAESRTATPCYFDLLTRELIWLDLTRNAKPLVQNRVEANQSLLAKLVEHTEATNRLSLKELIELSASRRPDMEVVEFDSQDMQIDIVTADVIYTLDKSAVLKVLDEYLEPESIQAKVIVTPSDMEILTSELL